MEKSRLIIESYQVVSMTMLKSSEGLKLAEAKIDTSKSMLVVIDAIRAGMTANYHNFLPSALSAAAASYYTPYHKPLIKNHDSRGAEPLGRIFDAKYLPETQTVRVWAYVSDEEAIQKIKDGRYQTVSIGANAADARCSICGHDYFAGECQHFAGYTFEDQLCMVNIYECEFSELSFVNVPACETAGVVDFGGEVPADLRDPDHMNEPGGMMMSNGEPVLTESAEADQPLKVTEMPQAHQDLHERFAAAAAAGEDTTALVAEHAKLVGLMQANHLHHASLDALDEAVIAEASETEETPAETEETVTETAPDTEETAPETTDETVTETAPEEPATETPAETEETPVEEAVEETAPETTDETVAETISTGEPAQEAAETPATDVGEQVAETAPVSQAINADKTATSQTEATNVDERQVETQRKADELQQKVDSLESDKQKLRNELEALQKANVDMAVLLHDTLTDRVIELKLSMDLLTAEEVETTRQSLQYRSAETLAALAEDLRSQQERQVKAAVQHQPVSGISVAEMDLVEVPTLVTEAGQASATPKQTAEEVYTEQVRSALKPRKR